MNTRFWHYPTIQVLATLGMTAALSERTEQRRVDVDAIPQILQAQVLVRGVLIVVVIRDWNSDHRRASAVLKQIHRNAAAEGRHADRRIAESIGDDLRDALANRRIDRRARRRITCAPNELHDVRMRESRRGLGRLAH